MLKIVSILAVALTLATSADVVTAKPVRSDGGACDTTGTARKTGTDTATNQKQDCLWDTCTYTTCSTSGGQISNCVKKTEYSNPRDCKAAARIDPNRLRGVTPGTGTLQRSQ